MLVKVLLFLISVLWAAMLAILQVKEVDKEGKKKDVTLRIERKLAKLFIFKFKKFNHGCEEFAVEPVNFPELGQIQVDAAAFEKFASVYVRFQVAHNVSLADTCVTPKAYHFELLFKQMLKYFHHVWVESGDVVLLLCLLALKSDMVRLANYLSIFARPESSTLT